MGIFSYLVDLIFCYIGICYSEIFFSLTVSSTVLVDEEYYVYLIYINPIRFFLWHLDLLYFLMNLFKIDILRKFIIWHCWHSHLLLISSKKLFLTENANIKNWQCCLKQRASDVNIFHVPPLSCAWFRIVDISVLFLIYLC